MKQRQEEEYEEYEPPPPPPPPPPPQLQDDELWGALQAIVARCSRFSGYRLESRFEQSRTGTWLLVIEDPAVVTRSTLVLARHLVPGLLREVYGRLRHWGITPKEEQVLLQALQAVEESPPPSPPVMMSPLHLDD
jgi:hypothetical protein